MNKLLQDPKRAIRYNQKTEVGFDTNGMCQGSPWCPNGEDAIPMETFPGSGKFINVGKNVDHRPCAYCYAVLPQKIAEKTGNWKRVRKPIERCLYMKGELTLFKQMGYLNGVSEIAMNISSDFVHESPLRGNWETDMVLNFLEDARSEGISVKCRTKRPDWVELLIEYGTTVVLSCDTIGFGVPWNLSQSLRDQYPDHVRIRLMARNEDEAREVAKHADVVTMYHSPNGVKTEHLRKQGFRALMHGRAPFLKLALDLDGKLCCVTGRCATCQVKCGWGS